MADWWRRGVDKLEFMDCRHFRRDSTQINSDWISLGLVPSPIPGFNLRASMYLLHLFPFIHTDDLESSLPDGEKKEYDATCLYYLHGRPTTARWGSGSAPRSERSCPSYCEHGTRSCDNGLKGSVLVSMAEGISRYTVSRWSSCEHRRHSDMGEGHRRSYQRRSRCWCRGSQRTSERAH